MKTAIVILNWNGKHFLEEFLPILISETPEETSIIIADNGSTDDSIDWIEHSIINKYNNDSNASSNARLGHGIYNYSTDREIHKFDINNLHIIRFDSNLGFTVGYNKALEQIDAEYYVIMNSDIRVPSYKELIKYTQGLDSNWLTPMIDFLDNHPEAGICMPKILSEREYIKNSKNIFEYAGASGGFIDKYGYPFCRGRILSNVESDTGQYNTPTQIFWASGACMVIRSSLFKLLGGFDKDFFAHMEEIDLCWRAKLLGWQIWVIPQSKVYHVGGGTLPNNSPRKLYLNYRNNLLMLYKNLPLKDESWQAFGYKNRRNRNLHIFVRQIIDGMSAIVYILQGKIEFFKAVVKAHKDFHKMKGEVTISPRLKNFYNSNSNIGIYKKSIIKSFFCNKRRFSDLDI